MLRCSCRWWRAPCTPPPLSHSGREQPPLLPLLNVTLLPAKLHLLSCQRHHHHHHQPPPPLLLLLLPLFLPLLLSLLRLLLVLLVLLVPPVPHRSLAAMLRGLNTPKESPPTTPMPQPLPTPGAPRPGNPRVIPNTCSVWRASPPPLPSPPPPRLLSSVV